MEVWDCGNVGYLLGVMTVITMLLIIIIVVFCFRRDVRAVLLPATRHPIPMSCVRPGKPSKLAQCPERRVDQGT